MFTILVITLFSSVWLYLRHRIKHYIILPWELPKWVLYFFDIVMLSVAVFRYFYRMQGVEYYHSGVKEIFYIGYSAIGLFAYIMLFTLAFDLFMFIKSKFAPKKTEVENSGRRLFIKRALTLTGLTTLEFSTTARAISNAQKASLKKVDLHHPKLPESFQNFKIAQISDLHLGPIIDKDYLQSVVETIMSQNPDVIVFTGDMIDGHVHVLKDQFEPLKKLSAPHGIFFITGNHEYYWKADEWIEFFSSQGLTHLLNQNHLITRNESHLLLCGIPDHGGKKYFEHHRIDLDSALRCEQNCDFKILLAHRPDIADSAVQLGFDLLLSGHTHGGQTFPFNMIVGLVQKYLKGIYHVDNLLLYVSAGTGYWGPPIRLGVPAEVTLLSLKKGPFSANT